MSHFCGLVINTKNAHCYGDLEESLRAYDENLVLPMHKVLTKEEMIERGRKRIQDYKENFYNEYLKDPEAYKEKHSNEAHIHFISQEFPKKLNCTDEEIYDDFFSEYRDYIEDGEDWCKIGLDGSLWETTNENAKWDWYDIGGRWDEFIKTKDGEFVNECELGDIDLTPFSDDDYEPEEKEDWEGNKYRQLKEGVKNHITKENPAFCLVVDGEWFEKGKMGWWGITTDENENWKDVFNEIIAKLPADSEVILVDFHI